ncbi:MAG TPA: SGNH/GDSL hydrolase family protein [Reyranellaceae bacterium]|nr:SGNH/GDSL hydrolase family protein [Reyranellaceae bacterium]
MAKRLANAGLIVASVAVSLLLIELAFRLAMGLPLLKVEDWRMQRLTDARVGEHAQFDPLLGWVPRANYASQEHNTLDHGVRRNGGERELRTGSILTVGDSFTEGWDVDDDETWPAWLEMLGGAPVVNAGVGGYGTDQIVLRAEQLLPIVRPHTLIVGFLSFDIHRTGHAAYGASKPWFTVERGELRYHPPAPPEARGKPTAWARTKWAVRDFLARFAVIDFIMARLDQNFWYGGEKREYVKANNDPVQVTCLLLERLKKQADAMKVRTLLFMQYYAEALLEMEQQPADARQVMACAGRAGYEVVDHFPSLKAIVRSNAKALRDYYVVDEEGFHHMNETGNEHAAALLLRALRRE